MFNPRQSVRTPLDYDGQFECQLPPEVRAELETSHLSEKSRPGADRDRRRDPGGDRVAQKSRLSAAYRTSAGSASADPAASCSGP